MRRLLCSWVLEDGTSGSNITVPYPRRESTTSVEELYLLLGNYCETVNYKREMKDELESAQWMPNRGPWTLGY